MPAEGRHLPSFHFSTAELPTSKRSPAVQELFERVVCLDIHAEPDQPIDMTVHSGPGMRRIEMRSSFTACLARPARMLADGDDTVCLMIKTGGSMAVTQHHREGVPELGDGVLLVYREAALVQFAQATYLAVRVPFTALAPMANVQEAAARRIPRDTEALRLLRNYLSSLPARIADPQLAQLSATHVYDLMALAIGATDEGRRLAGQRGVRAARLDALKADLIRNPRLDIGQLAALQRISARYVQMLFEEDGTTFSEFALGQRLEAARNMLVSPRYVSWSVTAIALEAGFNDLSHFNRRFKQRYLTTPSGLRSPA